MLPHDFGGKCSKLIIPNCPHTEHFPFGIGRFFMEALNYKKLKPHIGLLVEVFMIEFGNDDEAGGSLHILLDDGNVDDVSIGFCRKGCESRGDTFGVFLCNVIQSIPKSSRWRLFNKDWNTSLWSA